MSLCGLRFVRQAGLGFCGDTILPVQTKQKDPQTIRDLRVFCNTGKFAVAATKQSQKLPVSAPYS